SWAGESSPACRRASWTAPWPNWTWRASFRSTTAASATSPASLPSTRWRSGPPTSATAGRASSKPRRNSTPTASWRRGSFSTSGSVGTSQRAVRLFQRSVALSDGSLELPTERWNFPMDRWTLPTERWTLRWAVGASDRALELPNGLLDSSNGASYFPIDRWNFRRSVGFFQRSAGLPDKRVVLPLAVFRAKGARSLSPAHRAGTPEGHKHHPP